MEDSWRGYIKASTLLRLRYFNEIKAAQDDYDNAVQAAKLKYFNALAPLRAAEEPILEAYNAALDRVARQREREDQLQRAAKEELEGLDEVKSN